MKAVLVVEENDKAHVEYQGDNGVWQHGTSASKQEAIDFAIAWAQNEVEHYEIRVKIAKHDLEMAKKKLAAVEELNG